MPDTTIAKIVYEKNKNLAGKIPNYYTRNITNEWGSGTNDIAGSVGW